LNDADKKNLSLHTWRGH